MGPQARGDRGDRRRPGRQRHHRDPQAGARPPADPADPRRPPGQRRLVPERSRDLGDVDGGGRAAGRAAALAGDDRGRRCRPGLRRLLLGPGPRSGTFRATCSAGSWSRRATVSPRSRRCATSRRVPQERQDGGDDPEPALRTTLEAVVAAAVLGAATFPSSRAEGILDYAGTYTTTVLTALAISALAAALLALFSFTAAGTTAAYRRASGRGRRSSRAPPGWRASRGWPPARPACPSGSASPAPPAPCR